MAFVSLICLLAGLHASAQKAGSDKPTWGGNKPIVKMPDGYEPREIRDVFAAHAVTLDDMMERARYVKYMPGEIVVAMEMAMTKDRAFKEMKSYSWPSLFQGKPVSLIVPLMSVDRKNGLSVSLAHLRLPQGMDVFEAMRIVNQQPGVLWSSPNFMYDGDPRDYTPNDTRYGEQYHHTKMQNNLAWDITKGSPSVIVAFTDDGCELTHSDLSANIWVNPGEIAGNGIDDDNNGFVDDVNGWDFSFNNNNPANNTAGDSHGTHVGGIIGARIDNNNGVAGVAGLTTIMPVQFYGTGGAAWTATMNNQAFTYAVNNGAKIVNTSYNIDGFANDPVFIAGVQYVIDNNCLHFNSAGNNSQQNPPRQAVTQTILVASTTSTDAKSSFSNYGTGVDLSSPGSGILSTVTGNTYAFYDGTSMATPNAAGAAALVWAANPGWNNYQVAAQLLGTADNIDAVNPTLIGQLGSGRVNSFKALTNTLPAPKVSATTLPAEGAGINPGTLSSFNLSFNQVMDPASANQLSNYQLIYAGTNGTFGDGDDASISLNLTTVYRVGTNALSFSLPGGALTCGNYRFRVVSGGLKNPFNTSLDGDGNGTGGDAFVRNFFVGAFLYTDADGDGYGTGSGSFQNSCLAGNGFATVAGDCNDGNASINPGATEICGNNVDDNCDGLIDFISSTPGAPQTFSNTTSISIPDVGIATPYPSSITVSGMNGTISKLRVSLKQFTHTFPGDVDVLLVGPSGQKLILLSDMGGGTAITNVNLLFDDAGSALGNTLTSGTFRPANAGADDPFTTPAPAGPYGNPASAGTATLASVFGNSNPNGTWSLYVVDDASGDLGSFGGGWELELTTFTNLCNAISAPTMEVTQPTCAVATGSITVTSPLGPQYSYSIGGAFQAGPLFSNVSPGTYIVTVLNSQTNATATANATINAVSGTAPATPGAVQGQANVCPYAGTSTQLTYSVNAVAGATSYNWTTPPTVTLISGQGTRTITVTINSNFLTDANRLFRVTASNSCGTSNERLYWLTAILPGTPSAIVASSTNVCPSIGTGIPITYTIRKVSAATSYIWTTQAGTTTITHPNGLGVNDTTVTVIFSSGFTTSPITVQAVNSCGTSNARSLNIVRNNPPNPGMISGPMNVCSYIGSGGQTATYTVPPVTGATSYNWNLPAGSLNVTGQGTNSISFKFPGGYTGGPLSVTASNGCGTSNARSLTVNTQGPGTLGTISAVQTGVCPSRTYTYSVASMPSNTLSINWTVPAGASILSGQGTISISVAYPSTAVTGAVTATPQNGCRSGATRSLSVNLAECGLVFTAPQQNPVSKIAGEPKNKLELLVYPNPSVDKSQALVSSSSLAMVTIRIFDLQGRLLSTRTINPNQVFNIGHELHRGSYMLEASQGDRKTTTQWLKL